MRLDVYLADFGYTDSRTEAKNLITDGVVMVNGKIITKPAFDVNESHEISVGRTERRYVSRGGLKLEYALDKFSVSARDVMALDVGASSGGFTDCLLKRGARHVIAVDSGSGQLSTKLMGDDKITLIENFNARYMKPSDFEYIPNFCVMDVSFISATLIMPAIFEVLCDGGDFICLIKPQFEVGREHIGKGGIVKDPRARERALMRTVDAAREIGFTLIGWDVSPIVGGDGNVEYLAYFKKRGKQEL